MCDRSCVVRAAVLTRWCRAASTTTSFTTRWRCARRNFKMIRLAKKRREILLPFSVKSFWNWITVVYCWVTYFRPRRRVSYSRPGWRVTYSRPGWTVSYYRPTRADFYIFPYFFLQSIFFKSWIKINFLSESEFFVWSIYLAPRNRSVGVNATIKEKKNTDEVWKSTENGKEDYGANEDWWFEILKYSKKKEILK